MALIQLVLLTFSEVICKIQEFDNLKLVRCVVSQSCDQEALDTRGCLQCRGVNSASIQVWLAETQFRHSQGLAHLRVIG